MDPLISIIVPVYNVENYVRRCLESIAAQTYSYFECLIIDDGSHDLSGTICDAFHERDSRFQVLHQSNMGLGPARNTGLDRAKGDYIWFVDADDTVSPEMLKTLYELISSGQFDWSMVGFTRIDEQGYASPSLNKITFDGQTITVLSGNDSVERLWTDRRESLIYTVVWNKLYSRQVIGRLRFEDFLSREDFPFNHKIYHKTHRGVFLRKPLYQWYHRTGSLSQIPFSPQKATASIAAVISLKNDFLGERDSVWGVYLESTYSLILSQRYRIKGTPYYSRYLKDCRALIRNTLLEYLFRKDISLKERFSFIVLWPFPEFVARHYFKDSITGHFR